MGGFHRKDPSVFGIKHSAESALPFRVGYTWVEGNGAGLDYVFGKELMQRNRLIAVGSGTLQRTGVSLPAN